MKRIKDYKRFTLIFILFIALFFPTTISSAENLEKEYTIQIKAVQSKTEAEQISTDLNSKGYSSYIIKSDLPEKGLWYRIRIGKFKNRSQAKKIAEEFKRKEKMDYYIASYMSPKIDSNEYLKYLDLIVLELQNLKEDIETMGLPWKISKEKKILRSLKPKTACLEKVERVTWDEFIKREFENIKICMSRQKFKMWLIKKQVESIAPPDEFKEIHEILLSLSKTGTEMIDLQEKLFETSYLGKEIKVDRSKEKQREFKNLYLRFLNKYKQYKNENNVNNYFLIVDGTRNSYHVSLAYENALNWQGPAKINWKVLKIINNTLLSAMLTKEGKIGQWENEKTKKLFGFYDLNGNGTKEIIIQWSYASFAIYSLNPYFYYQEMVYRGTAFADGDAVIKEIKDFDNDGIMDVKYEVLAEGMEHIIKKPKTKKFKIELYNEYNDAEKLFGKNK